MDCELSAKEALEDCVYCHDQLRKDTRDPIDFHRSVTILSLIIDEDDLRSCMDEEVFWEFVDAFRAAMTKSIWYVKEDDDGMDDSLELGAECLKKLDERKRSSQTDESQSSSVDCCASNAATSSTISAGTT